MRQEKLLSVIKKAVLSVVPEAEVIAYGDRITHDADSDTCWELLVLTGKIVNDQMKREIKTELSRVEMAIGNQIELMIRSRDQWYSLKNQSEPFFRLIEKTGQRL